MFILYINTFTSLYILTNDFSIKFILYKNLTLYYYFYLSFKKDTI